MSQCGPQHTLLSTLLFWQMFIAMIHWSDLRPLASATPPTGSSLGLLLAIQFFPVLWRAQLWICKAPLCISAVHRWGKCWGGPTQSSASGTERSLSWLALQLCHSYALGDGSLTTPTFRAISTVLPRHSTLQSAAAGEGSGQLSCSDDLKPNSTSYCRCYHMADTRQAQLFHACALRGQLACAPDTRESSIVLLR